MRTLFRTVLVLTIFLALFNRRSYSLAKSCMTMSSDYKIVASKLKEITQLEKLRKVSRSKNKCVGEPGVTPPIWPETLSEDQMVERDYF